LISAGRKTEVVKIFLWQHLTSLQAEQQEDTAAAVAEQ
jgi:hypothetical protein